jgi:hypothetical protein
MVQPLRRGGDRVLCGLTPRGEEVFPGPLGGLVGETKSPGSNQVGGFRFPGWPLASVLPKTGVRATGSPRSGSLPPSFRVLSRGRGDGGPVPGHSRGKSRFSLERRCCCGARGGPVSCRTRSRIGPVSRPPIPFHPPRVNGDRVSRSREPSAAAEAERSRAAALTNRPPPPGVETSPGGPMDVRRNPRGRRRPGRPARPDVPGVWPAGGPSLASPVPPRASYVPLRGPTSPSFLPGGERYPAIPLGGERGRAARPEKMGKRRTALGPAGEKDPARLARRFYRGAEVPPQWG